ncbi:alpha/beta fold hydrolase [Rhizobium sp. Rhizsp82]|uniref:alpha/beta fold hydrolase n=1 Tax=Rhizobium sp. Rhizsp82 TaxID=3243057 RepID=UPI0039B47246
MRSIAIRIVKILAGVAGALIGVALLVFAGFYAASIWRESLPPGRNGQAGQYLQADGLDLHYKQWGPQSGPAILLIPGAMAWSETWAPIAERLGASGFRVIAPDLPPFGYSERPASGDYSRQAQARRILAFADAAGLQQFVLLGHSFGGGATMETALIAPDRISGLVLLDVALGLGRPPSKPPLAPLFAAPGLREAIMAATFTNPLMIGKGLRDFVADDDAVATAERIEVYRRPLVVKGTSHAIADWFVTGLFGNEEASRAFKPENYQSFQKPALLVWGKEDSVTPLAQGEEIARLLPKAQLSVLDGVNHIPQIEAPEKTASLIAAFVSSLQAPGSN